MTYDVVFVETLPDPEAYREMMVEFFTGVGRVLGAAGGPDLQPVEMAEEALAYAMRELLPPKGRLAFAVDDAERALGTAGFRLLQGGATAEFKRMYVRPEARGKGLGRALLEARMAEAKAMGCRRIVADTVRGNTEMLTLYRSFGFRDIPRYPENGHPLELDPFLVFLEYDLDGDG